jgi:hypothetical protein
MTGNATAAIKACIGRTPGASDIAQGTMAPIFWNGSNSGVYHVLIRQWNAIWKYKNDVTFEDGKNTTPFGFAAMNVMTYSGSQEDRFLLIKNVAGNTRVRIITENITPTTNFDTYFEDAGTLPNLVATGQGMYPVLRWESGANLNNTYNVMLGLLDETWNNIVQVKYQNGVRFENGFGEVDWNTMIGKKYVAELFRGDYSHDDGSLSLTESDVAVNGTTYSGIYTEGGGTASTSGQTGTYTYFYLNEMKIGIGAFISGHGFQLAFGTAVTENISGIRGGWNPSPDIDISDFGTSPFNIFVYRN